jgi:pimeloyl-ACP methyl ester carboxylesterase
LDTLKPTRRTVLKSVSALGVAAGATYLFRAKHVIPPQDSSAEQRFRELQNRALLRHGLRAESRHIAITDPPLRVHFLEAGAGEPLLFIHGGNSVAAGWIPLLAKLDGRRLIAADRPGCGLTDKFNYSNVRLRRHASAFVRSVMEALELPRATLAANSMGGYFALAFALDHAERVSKLVLLGEPAGSAPRIRLANRLVGTRVINSALFFSVLEPGPETMRNSLHNMLVAHPERVSDELFDCLTAGAVIPGAAESWITMNESVFSPAGAGLFSPTSTLTYALRPELKRLRVPTLLLWGDRDTFGPPTLGQEMADLMPDARCEVIPDAGHLPWLDNPDLCAQLMRSFLA